MATRRYGISRGENVDQVTEAAGAAIVSDSMEFTFDLASSLTKEDVLLGLDKIRMAIVKDDFPPA